LTDCKNDTLEQFMKKEGVTRIKDQLITYIYLLKEGNWNYENICEEIKTRQLFSI